MEVCEDYHKLNVSMYFLNLMLFYLEYYCWFLTVCSLVLILLHVRSLFSETPQVNFGKN